MAKKQRAPRLEYAKRYREEHREELRTKYREYRQRNLSASRTRSREWARAEKLRNPTRKPTQTPEQRRKYYEANKEQISARVKEYKKKNHAKVIASQLVYTRNRRARIRNSEGLHSAKDIANLYMKQGKKCATCKTRISNQSGPFKFEVDHVMPISRGGSNDQSNLQLLCSKCNRSKQAKHPDEWAKEHGLLFC